MAISTYFCIRCGREFRPRDADTVICPACGGPPEASVSDQPQGTVRVEQPRGIAQADPPHGTVRMEQGIYQRMCIICGTDFVTSDPQAVHCPQCRGEAPKPQQGIISKPEGAQGTVAVRESDPQPAPSSSAADVPLVWNAGDVILDLYEVKGELGKGGMGVVYRVHHRQWHIDLAVKTPKPEELQKAGGLENFVREAQAWVDLGLHPHIVTCYYVRRLGEVPRVFAECMEGGSLKNWMEDGRLYAGGEREALKRILDVGIQFAWGLGYAHEKGLVHQDVKPGNALMTPDGMLKVTDFGLVGAKGYTKAYAAPEQELGQAVSPRTDIWCWGVSVLEMFTGEIRWASGSIAASVLENYLQEAPPEGIPPMPGALAELLRQCFQNDPDLRPASMDEVAKRLMRLYEQETGAPYPRQKPNALELRADSLNNKGVAFYELDQEEEAIKCFEEALRINPVHFEAYCNRLLVLWKRGELTDMDVLETLTSKLQSIPNLTYESYVLGVVHLHRQKPKEALEILQNLVDNFPEIRILHLLTENAKSHIRQEAIQVFRALTPSSNSLAVSISTEGTFAVSGGLLGKLFFWEISEDSVKEIGTMDACTSAISSVSLSPDRKWLALAHLDGSVNLWKIDEIHLERPQQKVDTAEHKAVIFADFITMSGTQSRSDLARLAEMHSVKQKQLSPTISWVDRYHYVIGRENGTLEIWEIGKKKPKIVHRFHQAAIVCVSTALNADGLMGVSCDIDGVVSIWGTDNLYRKFSAMARSVSIFPNQPNLVIVGTADGNLDVYDWHTNERVVSYKAHKSSISAIASFRSGTSVFAVSGDQEGYVRLWDLSRGNCISTIAKSFKPCYSIALSSSGETIIVGCQNELIVSHIGNTQPLRIGLLISFTPTYTSEQISNARRFSNSLARARKLMEENAFREAMEILVGAIEIAGYEYADAAWTLIQNCSSKGIPKRIKKVLPLHTSPSGYYQEKISLLEDYGLAASFAEGSYIVQLWNPITGENFRTLEHDRTVTTLCFSPNGKFLLSADYAGFIHVWETTSGLHLGTMEEPDGKVFSITFEPAGKYFFTGSFLQFGKGASLKMWDFQRKKCVRSFEPGEKDAVFSVDCSPDGRLIVGGGYDKVVRVWDVATSKCIWSLVGHTDQVRCVRFAPSARFIVSGDSAGMLFIWNIDMGSCEKSLRLDGSVKDICISAGGHTFVCANRVFMISPTSNCAEVISGISPGDTLGMLLSLNLLVVGGRRSVYRLLWDYDFPDPADWDEGARPYLDIFLTLHTPYGPDGLSRVGKPQWTEEDFQKLLQELGYRGYGWLRPEGVRRELEKMAKERS